MSFGLPGNVQHSDGRFVLTFLAPFSRLKDLFALSMPGHRKIERGETAETRVSETSIDSKCIIRSRTWMSTPCRLWSSPFHGAEVVATWPASIYRREPTSTPQAARVSVRRLRQGISHHRGHSRFRLTSRTIRYSLVFPSDLKALHFSHSLSRSTIM